MDEMVAVLGGIAAAGGTALVEAAATDAWTGVKGQFVRLLGGGDPDRERLQDQVLEQTRQAIVQAGGAGREQVAAMEIARLQAWLLQPMLADRRLADQIQELVDQLRAGANQPGGDRYEVHQSARADRGGVVNQAGRDLYQGGSQSQVGPTQINHAGDGGRQYITNTGDIRLTDR